MLRRELQGESAIFLWNCFGNQRLTWTICGRLSRGCPFSIQRRVFWSSKVLRSVLNVLTLKFPTLTRRCYLQFTTLRLATDNKELMVCRAWYLHRQSWVASLLLTQWWTIFVYDAKRLAVVLCRPYWVSSTVWNCQKIKDKLTHLYWKMQLKFLSWQINFTYLTSTLRNIIRYADAIHVNKNVLDTRSNGHLFLNVGS